MVVYQELLNALGNPGYNELMDILETSSHVQVERTMETAEFRFEKRLSEEMGLIRKEISELKEYLIDRMDAQFRWMVAMWLTQMIACLGIFAAILQLALRGNG
jgi:hypothetical protein